MISVLIYHTCRVRIVYCMGVHWSPQPISGIASKMAQNVFLVESCLECALHLYVHVLAPLRRGIIHTDHEPHSASGLPHLVRRPQDQ